MTADTMENKIVVALTPMGLIMGRYAEGILTNPRAFTVNNNDKGEGTVRFLNIIGDPDIFFIGNASYYLSENPSINELYVDSVSSIRVIHAA
uniref:Uncharacterized protein n=1 Tax=viral metagenome TaxID=1070528 RepID=A0A6M3LLV1_9ZZZZ